MFRHLDTPSSPPLLPHSLCTCPVPQELKAEARGQTNPSARGYTSAPQQLPTSATTPASSYSNGAGERGGVGGGQVHGPVRGARAQTHREGTHFG